ncbi:MAG: hypothetical protein QOI36_4096 [Pseudonocardiales bacterium]|jgi:hypothetical protein|nr:hypothetical protein [Pseudonocardiales bacterium]
MSSDTDHPRQRTVAELLAEHGDAGATGRRRRRRAPDEVSGEEAAGPPLGNGTGSFTPEWRPAQAPEPDRSMLRERVPPVPVQPPGRRQPEPWESVREPPERQARESLPREREPWEARQRESQPWESVSRESRVQQPPPWEQQSRVQEPPSWEPRAREPQPWEAQPRERLRPSEPLSPEPLSRDPLAPWDSQPRDPRPRESQSRESQSREAQSRDAPPREGRSREAVSWESRPWESRPPVNGAEREPDAARSGPPLPRAGERTGSPAVPGARAPLEPVRERPTEQMAPVRSARPVRNDQAPSGRVGSRRPGAPDAATDLAPAAPEYHSDVDGRGPDDGPPTEIGAAPVGAESWHRKRTNGRRGPVPDDGGPRTEASAPVDFDDHPAGLGGADLDDFRGHPDYDGDPDYEGDYDHPDDGDADEADERTGLRQRLRLPKLADSAGQVWAAVVAQWIIGAVGGAALWVGFRFLWRSLPVVALAAAVLITAGLVVVVRALLRNDDTRTTLFAVLVGLLLTVSPAILVLLGR